MVLPILAPLQGGVQTEETKKVPSAVGVAGEVEISFLNGSSVRMVIQSEMLEIATPYGKLAVPAKHLRAI